MKPIKYLLLAAILSFVFLTPAALSQNKFEFGVSIDPLVIPINLGTYVENGPGFYEINGRGKLTQAGSAYLTYWAFNSVGISLGAGLRGFRSQIDYSIPDPIIENGEPLIERSYPFTAKGLGPSLSVLFRKDRWKARLGLGLFDLFDQKYTSNYSTSAVTIWESGGEVLVDIQVTEQAYWYRDPTANAFLQFEGQYNLTDNLFIKLSFETSGNGVSYPYTLKIEGFTPETVQQVEVLNDYEMRNMLNSFSVGVGYNIGFGRYKDRKEE